LKAAGYHSTLIGKWHLGLLPNFGPLQSGYDRFYGFRGGAVDYFAYAAGSDPDLWDNDTPVQQTGYLTQVLGKRAVEAVDRYAQSQQPFLLSLHFSAPHWPWEGPEDEAESKRLAQPESEGLFHFDGGTQQTYHRMIEAMDQEIGRVLDALEANGLTENTIVIFTSDNGGERFSNNWPFSGSKTELLEGGLRVPTIISWPACIPKGRTTEQVAISMDWLPTLLAAAGTQPDPAYPTDGVNLLPVLTEEIAPMARKLFWRYKANAQRAMRDGDLKYLKIGENTFLFNLAEDPRERANLNKRRKDDYQRLAREWYEWNATMLPQMKDSYSGGNVGRNLAEHYSRQKSSGEPDISAPPEAARSR
jgi:arylsulfatase A-like enzyme